MVSNYDRIYLEITKRAEQVERQHGVAADDLTTLVMEIVDLEDRNRIKPQPRINKDIANMIDQAAKMRVRTDRGV